MVGEFKGGAYGQLIEVILRLGESKDDENVIFLWFLEGNKGNFIIYFQGISKKLGSILRDREGTGWCERVGRRKEIRKIVYCGNWKEI